MVRRSIISFNNAILVFIDRDKNWVWKVKKREVKVLYHLSCGYLCYIISSSWYSFPMIQPKVWSKSDSGTYMIVLCAQLLSHVWLFVTPMDCSPPGSSVHGDSPGKNTGLGCHAFLQGIFLAQESNRGLLHCKQILYQLSCQGSPHMWLLTVKWLKANNRNAYSNKRLIFLPRSWKDCIIRIILNRGFIIWGTNITGYAG